MTGIACTIQVSLVTSAPVSQCVPTVCPHCCTETAAVCWPRPPVWPCLSHSQTALLWHTTLHYSTVQYSKVQYSTTVLAPLPPASSSPPVQCRSAADWLESRESCSCDVTRAAPPGGGRTPPHHTTLMALYWTVMYWC